MTDPTAVLKEIIVKCLTLDPGLMQTPEVLQVSGAHTHTHKYCCRSVAHTHKYCCRLVAHTHTYTKYCCRQLHTLVHTHMFCRSVVHTYMYCRSIGQLCTCVLQVSCVHTHTCATGQLYTYRYVLKESFAEM